MLLPLHPLSRGSSHRDDLPRAQPIECYSLAFRRFKFHLTFLTLDQMQASLLWFSLNRKVGRVIDRAGLEIRYTPFGYRGFESLTFRKRSSTNKSWNSFFNPFFYAPVSKPPLPPVPLVNTFVVTWLLTPSLMAMALMVVVSSMVKGWVYSVSFASGSSPFSE